MILTPQEVNEVEGDVFGRVTVSAIDTTKLSKLYGILSGVYKNIHGAIIREYCSNAWDSHTAAGKQDEPIIVELTYANEVGSLIIKDVGLGMSPETMESIYFNYLSSTKEDSNLLIGAFGMGSKSALAYHHTFFITTVYEGIKYEYMFSKQADGIPAGELLKQSPTQDCNGTIITIPVKSYVDYRTFVNAINDQLAYFPNVYVLLNGSPLHEYKIYENDLFYYNTDYRPTSKLHIALGCAAYTIDYEELGIDPISLPFAIKFNIGELTPTPSREDIIYTSHSIALIKERIDKVIEWVHAKIKEVVRNDLSIKEYMRVENTSILLPLTENIRIQLNERSISNKYSHSIKGSDNILTSYKIVNYLKYFGWAYTEKEKVNDVINFSDYKVREVLKLGYTQLTRLSYTIRNVKLVSLSDISEHKMVIRDYNPDTGEFAEPTDVYKNAYIKDTKYGCAFIYKVPRITKSMYVLLEAAMATYGINKAQLKKYISILSELADEYVKDTCLDYAKIVPPSYIKEQVDARKNDAKESRLETVRRIKEQGKYSYQILNRYGEWEDRSDTLINIRKIAKVIVYFEKTNRVRAKELGKMLNVGRNSKYAVISIAKSHMKTFAKDPHVYYYKVLFETPTTFGQSLISKALIKKLQYKIDYTCQNLLKQTPGPSIFPELHSTYQSLINFSGDISIPLFIDDWAKACLVPNHRHADKIDAAKKLVMQCAKLQLGYIRDINDSWDILKTIAELCNIPVVNKAYIKEKFHFNK